MTAFLLWRFNIGLIIAIVLALACVAYALYLAATKTILKRKRKTKPICDGCINTEDGNPCTLYCKRNGKSSVDAYVDSVQAFMDFFKH